MADHARPARSTSGLAAFIDPETRDGHIVDIMIEERCPVLGKALVVAGCAAGALFRCWAIARRCAGRMRSSSSNRARSVSPISTGCSICVSPARASSVCRARGRAVIVSNHPTGLADGSIVLAALAPIRTDIEIMANADACRINPRFAEVIIPVEWVQDKRTHAEDARDTAPRPAATFANERLLMIFPSGALAQMREGKLVDEPWHADSRLAGAQEQGADHAAAHRRAQLAALLHASAGSTASCATSRCSANC